LPSASEGKKIHVTISAMAPRMSAYPASDVGGGVTRITARIDTIAPISPMAPIVCRNLTRRRMAFRRLLPCLV
jgi:hypothetical protein